MNHAELLELIYDLIEPATFQAQGRRAIAKHLLELITQEKVAVLEELRTIVEDAYSIILEASQINYGKPSVIVVNEIGKYIDTMIANLKTDL